MPSWEKAMDAIDSAETIPNNIKGNLLAINDTF